MKEVGECAGEVEQEILPHTGDCFHPWSHFVTQRRRQIRKFFRLITRKLLRLQQSKESRIMYQQKTKRSSAGIRFRTKLEDFTCESCRRSVLKKLNFWASRVSSTASIGPWKKSGKTRWGNGFRKAKFNAGLTSAADGAQPAKPEQICNQSINRSINQSIHRTNHPSINQSTEGVHTFSPGFHQQTNRLLERRVCVQWINPQGIGWTFAR